MNWFYVKAGQSVGPISDTDFEGLAKSGEIQPDTLVWREGMANWQRAAEVQPALWSQAAAAPALSVAAGAPPVSGSEVVCTQCGRMVSKENAIQYSNNWVCAACKPVFIQRLKEGVIQPASEGGMIYGGFWIRFAAKIIDGLILGVVLIVPILLMAFSTGIQNQQNPGVFPIVLQLGLQLGYIVVSLGYNTFFLGKYGATPGKMACNLKVVTPQGGSLTFGRALGRSAGELLSGMICDIGYIIAAFDSEKRALHDHMASTRVIRK